MRSSSNTEGEVRRVLGKLEASGQDNEILRLVANSPNVFRPFVLMANALVFKAALPAADREAVVLHLAGKNQAAYERDSHQELAERAGLDEEKRRALERGEERERTDLFRASELLALRLCDRLVEDGMFDEADWEAAFEAWGPQGALDLVFTVAWWGGFVPIMLKAFGLEPKSAPSPPTSREGTQKRNRGSGRERKGGRDEQG